MNLEGSCHCGGVRSRLGSAHPYPFNRCYCSICRRTAGGGGYAVNLGGDHSSLEVEEEGSLGVYRAVILDDKTGNTRTSPARRHFCKLCGSALWVWDPRWPELVHPHASAIDTELPVPPEQTHLMVGSKPAWVELHADPDDRVFVACPEESLAAWHQRMGLEEPED